MRLCYTPLFLILFSFKICAAIAAPLSFTINLSEPVTVSTAGGTPRIAITVGSTTRYAVYTSGTGTSALTFQYTLQSGDYDPDGITLLSPIQLNGGTMKDAVGNDATLTYTLPNTSGIIIDARPPTGYTASLNADTITNVNKTALSFDLTYNKAGRTYNYAITSSGGAGSVIGNGTTTGSTQTISGINVTSLPDGKLTLSVTITDSFGATGSAVTDTASKAVLDSNLVGHWTFDTADISGVSVIDRSGSGINGTLINGTTTSAGQIGNAASFDGMNDTLTIPDDNIYDIADNISISLWYRSTNTPVGFANHIISKWSGGGIASDNFALYRFGTTWGSPDQTFFWAGRGGAWGPVSGSTIYSNNTWVHIGWTYNSTTGGRLYINGAAVGGSTGSGLLGTNNQVIRIISTSSPVPSLVDDVRIYNRVLTPAEISTIYNAAQ